MGQKSNLSTEQQVQLVVRLMSKEEPATQIARRAGITKQTLYRWCDEFVNGGKQALNARGTKAEQAMERLQSQVTERDQVIGELTIANRILKNVWSAPHLQAPVGGWRRQFAQMCPASGRGELAPRALMGIRACSSS